MQTGSTTHLSVHYADVRIMPSRNCNCLATSAARWVSKFRSISRLRWPSGTVAQAGDYPNRPARRGYLNTMVTVFGLHAP